MIVITVALFSIVTLLSSFSSDSFTSNISFPSTKASRIMVILEQAMALSTEPAGKSRIEVIGL